MCGEREYCFIISVHWLSSGFAWVHWIGNTIDAFVAKTVLGFLRRLAIKSPTQTNTVELNHSICICVCINAASSWHKKEIKRVSFRQHHSARMHVFYLSLGLIVCSIAATNGKKNQNYFFWINFLIFCSLEWIGRSTEFLNFDKIVFPGKICDFMLQHPNPKLPFLFLFQKIAHPMNAS